MTFKKILSQLMICAVVFQSIALMPAEASTPSNAPVTSGAASTAVQTLEGFKLISKTYSQEYQADLYLYEHVKSGGRIFYVAADDTHKAMDIIVKTPPSDETGANHILEHALLGGSEKYPTKSPFQTVNSTSVNTFANAITYTDYTAFPFSSNNSKDFDNLFKIYLDAIFAPKIVKDANVFKREGWRYNLEKDGTIGYKGVVYSEMMGLSSDPMDVHIKGANEVLYPGMTYSNESGGVPEKVVTLTHKQLVDTYQKYYQPSNMLIYLYGKTDLQAKLAYINQNYFSKYTKKAVTLNYGTLRPFEDFKRLENYYHVDAGAPTKEKSIYSINIALNGMSPKDLQAMSILVDLMCNTETSMFYQDFYDAKLGSDFKVSVDSISRMPSVSFFVYDTDKEKTQSINEFFMGELSYYVNNGFKKEEIKPQFEKMKLNEALKLNNVNKGEYLRSLVENGFNAHNDPAFYMDQGKMREQILNEALTTDYFQKLIKQWLIQNTPRATILTMPKVNLNQQKETAMKDGLKSKLGKLSAGALQTLKNEIKAFDLWNASQDKPNDLAKLPKLSKTDISMSIAEPTPIIEQIGSAKLITYELPTKDIGDINFYFDLKVLTESELKDLVLFKNYFLSLPTKTKSASELFYVMDNSTTGIDMGTTILTENTGGKVTDRRFYVTTTTLDEDLADTVELLQELMTNQRFESKSFTQYAINQNIKNLEYTLQNEGDDLAYTLLAKNFNPIASISNSYMEPQYAYLKDLSANFEQSYPALIERMQGIYRKLFTQNNLVVVFSGSKNSVAEAKPLLKDAIKSLRTNASPEQGFSFSPSTTKEAVIIPSQVQYVYKGFNLGQIGEKVSGSDFVFASLLSNLYMEKSVREQNGAYGGYFNVYMSGDMIFSSYRDPGLEASVKAMDNALPWLKSQTFNQEQIDAVIISLLGQLTQPEHPMSVADRLGKQYMAGVTEAEKEKFYTEILNTTPSDVTAFISKLERGMEKASLVVTGSESEINKSKDLFDKIRKVAE